MSGENRVRRRKRILAAMRRYVIFFLLIAFVITCCMLLFLYSMQSSMGINYTEKGIRYAAILTMGNVLLLSLLCTVIDAVRRRFMVERPVRRIVAGADKLMRGDLSTRIKPFHGIDSESEFDIIID